MKLENTARKVRRLNEGTFNFTRYSSFPGWGSRKEFPVINPDASNPKNYVYVSRRVVIRNA